MLPALLCSEAWISCDGGGVDPSRDGSEGLEGRFAERTSTPGFRRVTATPSREDPQLPPSFAAVTLPWLRLASSSENHLRGAVAHAPVGGSASCPSADTWLPHLMPCVPIFLGTVAGASCLAMIQGRIT